MNTSLASVPSILSYLSTGLLTYAVHSALACAIALLFGRVLLGNPRDRDKLWKAALLIPFATSALALGRLGRGEVRSTVDLGRLAHAVVPVHVPSYVMVRKLSRIGEPDEVVTVVSDPLARGIAIVVVIACTFAAGLATAALYRRQRRFTRQLRRRRVCDSGALRLSPRVTLTSADELDSPVALGRAEICVPAATFWAMPIAQQRSIIAHECAHLERRDPWWIAAADIIAAASAFQPLARRVARSLRRDAEFICDEEAVRHTGDAVTLVESLITLADQIDRACLDSVAVAYDGSPLVTRARRILAGPGSLAPRWVRLLRVCLVIVALCAPLAAPAISTVAHAFPAPPLGLVIEEDERVIERVLSMPQSRFAPEIVGR